MKGDDIDLILSKETEIAPSSGFARAVMDAVHSEASAPPPIPFPWKRALPGFAAGLILIVFLVIQIVRMPAATTSSSSVLSHWLSALLTGFSTAATYGVGWVLLSVLVTLVALKLSMRLDSRR